MSENSQKPPFRAGGFTLAEMLMSMAITVVIGAAILSSMVALRKSFRATEQYAIAQAGQARLLGYVGRDLRKLSGPGGVISPSIVTGSFTPFGTGLTTSNTLTLLVPGYYVSGTGISSNPLVYISGSTLRSGTMSYGPASSITTGTIQYFKSFQNFFGSQCYLRIESEGATSGTAVIVEKADGMLMELMRSGTRSNPASYAVRVRFTPSFRSNQTGRPSEPADLSSSGAEITATDWVLLRGTN